MRQVTIGAFARAAGVSVETVRYYQRRGLLPVPPIPEGGYRVYDEALVQRVRFIKQSQAAGFSLADIRTLLHLDATADRQGIQHLAMCKLAELTERLRHLEAVAQALQALIQACQQAPPEAPCPLLTTGNGREIAVDETPRQQVELHSGISCPVEAMSCPISGSRP